MTAQSKYQKLKDISYHTQILSGISQLLDWDQETKMPPGAGEIRSEQLKTLAGLIHNEKTGTPFREALKELVDIDTGTLATTDLNPAQQAAVERWRTDYKKAVALPSSFVEDFAKLTSQSIVGWRDAKEKNCFNDFAPHLTKIVDMLRKKADLIGYQDHPYDALLDTYEPDITTKEIAALFSPLRTDISALLKKILSAKQVDDSCIRHEVSAEKQLLLGKKILNDMGYHDANGRVDISSHPFSSSCHPTDSRITTRIDLKNPTSNISVLLHEGGHSLYEMGLPKEHYGTPLCEAQSLGVHESQSRWWETRIGQGKAFWKHYLPLLQEIFEGKYREISLAQFYQALNKVSPSFIRVDADEVTYPLHVILRFELEVALIEGKLKVKDLPEAWNAKMQELLQITPPNNALGCLQDIHWAMGAFGYFPTYTLGNMYAAQLFDAFEKKHSDWETKVEKGELAFIREWLHDAIHRHGRRYTTKELLQTATGTPFSGDTYVTYLNKKYGEIYGLIHN